MRRKILSTVAMAITYAALGFAFFWFFIITQL
jgi:hypothetical protein